MADRAIGRREFYLTSAFALLWLLVSYVLPPPPGLDTSQGSLDQSWQTALVDGFLHHAQLGTDLVFTYGPWGFLAEPRGDPAIYPWLASSRFVLSLGVSFGAAFLLLQRLRRRVWRLFWLVWFLALVSPWIAAPLLLYAVVFEGAAAPPGRLVLALLVPAAALSAHVKLVALPLVAMLGLLILTREVTARRIPWVSVSLAACYFAFYFAAGQRTASFLPFLHGAFSTMSGYSDGMALDGPAREAVLGALFCLAVPVAYGIAVRRRGLMALAGAIWVAAYFFMAFKQAFVRQDGGHIWAGILTFAVPASLVLLLFASIWWQRALAALAVAATIFFAWTTTPAGDLEHYLASRANALRTLPQAFQSRATLDRAWRGDLAAWREIYPIAPLSGTVDILPIDILTLFANSARYHPRPVIQSYAAVSPYLALLNSRFLGGARAADFILLDASAMDGRLPSTEDNLAWREILQNYQPAAFDGSYLALRSDVSVFREQDQGRDDIFYGPPLGSRKFLDRTVIWDQQIALDPASSDPVWAEIDLGTQPFGRLIDVLFRPPEVDLSVEASGIWNTYRLIVPLARSGFLLSPVVENPAAFALLYRAGQARPLVPSVRRFAVSTTSGGKSFYRPQITVRLYHLFLPPRPVVEMFDGQELPLAESIHAVGSAPDWDAVPAWNVDSGIARIQANAPSAGSIPYDGAAQSLDLAFGLANQCDDPDASRSRVEFRVSYRDRRGAADRMLLRRTLEARGEREVTAAEILPLPKGSPGSLQFATTPLEGNCRLGAYWSRVTLR